MIAIAPLKYKGPAIPSPASFHARILTFSPRRCYTVNHMCNT